MKDLLSVPIELWIVVLAVVFGLGLIAFIIFSASIVKALRTLQGVPEKRDIVNQPLQVEEFERFATKGEVAEIQNFVSSVDNDLKSLRKEIVANGDKRREAIEAKVQSARDHCESQITQVNNQLSAKIDAMPAQIIAILRQTKDLL